MKLIRTFLLIVTLLLPFAQAKSQDYSVNGIKYTCTSPSEASVIGYEEGLVNAVIPNYIEGHKVTRIGRCAFQDCYSLVSVTIPSSVIVINAYAFNDCNNLISVIISNGVTTIGNDAFRRCKNLVSITIPNSVTYIGTEVFRDCINLTSATIPENITDIPFGLFCGCSSLSSITIPDGVTVINPVAFYGCSSLASINIPDGVISIGSSAFWGCSSLTSITIPDGVTSFENDVFSGCTNLQHVNIPDGVTLISNFAFNNCKKLSSITFPNSVDTIGACAFSGCESLTSVIIPGAFIISVEVFADCIGLQSVIIEDGVTTIGNGLFKGCNNLVSITIPESITNIEDNAFLNCRSLRSFVIPENVNHIGSSAFGECTGLRSVSIPCNLTNIEEYAFSGCSGLKYIILRGDEVAQYDVYRYYESYLFFVDAGMYEKYASSPGWKKINTRIYSDDMMPLRTVEVTADESRSALYEVLKDSSKYVANLKVKGTINGYDIMALRNKTSHLLYLDLSEADVVANDGGYEYYAYCSLKSDNEIGNKGFNGMRLISVTLPKTLKKIDDYAFAECSFLETVNCNEGLETIGAGAFRNCENLSIINLPNTLMTIGDNSISTPNFISVGGYNILVTEDIGVFQNCINLGPVITIPDKVSFITARCFYGCTSLDSVHIGKNVKEIRTSAFERCTNLSRVSFNKELSYVGYLAFNECSNLKSILLPYSVKIIDEFAFNNCRSLKSIKIPSMTKRIGLHAFYGCDDVEDVYTYTVEPVQIDQNTFSFTSSARLNVPKTSAELYEYNTQWSQFQTVREFDEPYDAFYLMGDYELNDNTGRLNGVPDAEMNSTSGLIVVGDDRQELSEIELVHDGTNCATILGAADDISGNQVNLTAKSMKVNISVEGNRWYFFCFPFEVDHDSIECSTDYMFYSYDGNKRANMGSGWVQMEQDFDVLNEGVGYVFETSSTGILTIHVKTDYLSFTANNEKEMLNLYTSDEAANSHWNFMGNPFISYYDVQDLAHVYDAPIVVWNGNSYDAYKPGDDDYQLKPFEAFFVQKETGASYVEFLPENRMTYNRAAEVSSLRAARRAKMGTPMNLDRQLVNISIMSQDSLTDRTRIVYSVNASMDYEIGVDAAKFQADGVPQIYTLNGKTKYAINERPMGSDEIKLGYTAPKAGTYTLSVPRHDAEVEIYDNVAKSKVDFTFGDYSFQSQAGTFNDRFVIYKTGGGVTKVDNGFRLDGMTVKTIDGGIVIEGNLTGKVQVYSESGMLLAEPRQAGRVDLGDGVYIIKVDDKSVKLNVNRGGYAI